MSLVSIDPWTAHRTAQSDIDSPRHTTSGTPHARSKADWPLVSAMGFLCQSFWPGISNSTSSGLYLCYHLCLSQLIFGEAWNSGTTMMLESCCMYHTSNLLIIWQSKEQAAFMLNLLRPLHVAVAAVITRNVFLLQFKLSLLTNK